MATRVAIQNPVASESCSPTLQNLNQLLRENKISDLKETFRAVIKAILDIRMRLPPIFKIDPKFILVDTATTEVLIIVNEDMFKTEI